MLENNVFLQSEIHTIISSWLVHPHILLTVCVAIIDCPLLEQVDEHIKMLFLTPPYIWYQSINWGVGGGYMEKVKSAT